MASIPRLRISDPSENWIGTPALLESEDKQSYLQLRAEIEREIDPKTVLDRIKVQDLTDKLWEERRFKRNQAALIASAKVPSLAMLLGPSYGDNLEQALKVAQDYFSGDVRAQKSAQQIVDRLGISAEVIEANAIHLRIGTIQALDSMTNSREQTRHRLVKDHLKRQRKTRNNGGQPTPGKARDGANSSIQQMQDS